MRLHPTKNDLSENVRSKVIELTNSRLVHDIEAKS